MRVDLRPETVLGEPNQRLLRRKGHVALGHEEGGKHPLVRWFKKMSS